MADDLLLRLINKNWLHEDFVSSAAFTPSSKDDGKLSLYSPDVFTAEDAFDHFTDGPLESVGVAGLSDTDLEAVQLAAIRDDEPFDGHVSVDFTGCAGGTPRKIGKKLKKLSEAHGWLYRPTSKAVATVGD